jgi:uncharacterized membrane protein
MKIVLALSLAVNFAILGLVGGIALQGFGDRGRPGVRDVGFGPFSEALTSQDRDALRRAFLGGADNPRAMQRQMRAEMGNLLDVIRTEPLQESALRDAFRRFQERSQERLDLGQRLLADRIIAMSPAERDRFANRLEEIVTRGEKRHRSPPPAE